jgi:hypothetical protein
MTLAAVLALLVLRLAPGTPATSTPAHGSTGTGWPRPSTSQPITAGPVSAAEPSTGRAPAEPSYVPPLQRINEGCSIARFGVPC